MNGMVKEFTNQQYDSVWAEFEARFRFQPSVSDFPGIVEPPGSRTSALADCSDPDLDASYDIFRSALREIFPHDATAYYLDWQHTCYEFSPLNDADSNLITFYPDGDYAVVLNPSMSDGIFGHPWEASLCFFGDHCLRYFENHPMPAMGKLMRKTAPPPQNYREGS